VTSDYYALDLIEKLNSLTRSLRKGFISLGVQGLIGHIFTDYGENHMITDPNGEPKIMALITGISQDGVVYTEDK
jgi:hypothetical protein